MNNKYFQILFYYFRSQHPTVQVSAKLALSQALLESAHFTSPLYGATNNMFGMQHPQVRLTTSMGPNAKGYATYRSPADSIKDYVLFLEGLGYLDDTKLAAAMKAGRYGTDPKYFDKVAAQAAAINGEIIPPAVFLAGGAAAVATALAAAVGAKKLLS